MTVAARLVLADARFAVTHHTDSLHGESFRTSWLTIVALLRAVGHVLSKVDREESDSLRRSIDKHWSALQRSKPDPAIFWHFIEFERNRFLKNYEHGILRRRVFFSNQGDMPIAIDLANSRSSMKVQVVNAGAIPATAEHGQIVSTIATGPFAGRREQELAQEAIAWWAAYLDAVDRDARVEA